MFCGWALLGYSSVGHGRDALQLGAAGIFYVCTLPGILRGHSAVGTARTLCGWALLYFAEGKPR